MVDGTLIASDRLAADRLFCSGKHRRHGMNVQALGLVAGVSLGLGDPVA